MRGSFAAARSWLIAGFISAPPTSTPSATKRSWRPWATTARRWTTLSWLRPERIGDDPGGAGERQVHRVHDPMEMAGRPRKQQWRMHEHGKDGEHRGEQDRRQPRLDSRKYRKAGGDMRRPGGVSPEHPSRRET